jgi:hypothetical protein
MEVAECPEWQCVEWPISEQSQLRIRSHLDRTDVQRLN